MEASLHLIDKLFKCLNCSVWLRDDRTEEMRTVAITNEFNLFGIDENQFHLRRVVSHDEGENHRVD